MFPQEVLVAVPDGLKASGAALWESLGHDVNTPAGRIALEACRSADRLDELDSIIQGKGVLELMQFRRVDKIGSGTPDEPVVIEVKFDNALGEARQQQNGIRQLLTTLDGMGAAAKPEKPVEDKPRSAVDEFTKRRRERGA